ARSRRWPGPSSQAQGELLRGRLDALLPAGELQRGERPLRLAELLGSAFVIAAGVEAPPRRPPRALHLQPRLDRLEGVEGARDVLVRFLELAPNARDHAERALSI